MTDLPPGWERTTLGEIAETSLGKMLDRGTFTGSNAVPYLRNINVQWGRFELEDILTIEIPPEQQSFFELRPGDLMVCEGGEIGRCAVWPGSKTYMAFQKALHRVRPYQGVDARFIRYLLEFHSHTNALVPYSTGSTIKHLPQQQLRRLPLSLPPHAEQRRIVTALEDHLSVIDAGLSALRAAQRKSFLFATVEREAVLRSDNHRPTVRLCEILREPLRNGCSGRATTNGSGVRVITLTAVTRNQFSNKNAKLCDVGNRDVSGLWLEPGDILIQRANTPDLVGTAALYSGEPNWAIFPDLLIRIRVNGDILAEFLSASLSTRRMRQYFKSSAKGLAGTMPKIDQGTVERATLWLPSLDVQRRVVDRMREIDRVVLKLNTDLKLAEHRAKQLRESLLADAFSGRLVPQNPTDEPAEALLVRIRAESAARLRVKRVRRIAKNANPDQESMP